MRKNKEWEGYSYDQLCFRKIMTSTVLDLEKARVSQQFAQAQESKTIATGIVGKLASSLNYFDYAMLAFRLGKSVIKLFRRK